MISELEKMIAEGEHLHQDFKYFISDAKKIARSIAAFANTDGGRLLIGVKDNGHIVGIKNEEDVHLIEAAAQFYCKPAVEYEPFIRPWQNKKVLEVRITKSRLAPHTAPAEDGSRRVYLRKADENKVASAVEEGCMRLRNSPDPISLPDSQARERIMEYFNRNALPLMEDFDYDTSAMSQECMIREKDCVEAICKMIILNETY